MKVLIFNESLRSGGKERRLLELLTYLKKYPKIELLLVLSRNEIHYKEFYHLNIPLVILERRFKKDIALFFNFYSCCKSFKPDIINSWGTMVSFYSIPSAVLLKIPLINNEITRAPFKIKTFDFHSFISRINFFFSQVIISNSREGIKKYRIEGMNHLVIHNGLNLNRFKNLEDKNLIKSNLKIKTDIVVGMVASFSRKKNYELFFEIAESIIGFKDDVTFLAIGGPDGKDSSLEFFMNKYKDNEQIIITGPINTDLESVMNLCDIGVLLTNRKNHGEGISNSILEFFALSKPVIANDTGGTKELLQNEYNGILLENEDVEIAISRFMDLINNKGKREKLGRSAYETVLKRFTIEQMGKEYLGLYSRYCQYFHKIL